MRHHWLLVMPATALLVAFFWNAVPAATVEFRFQSNGFRPDEIEIALCLGSREDSGIRCLNVIYIREQDRKGLSPQDREGA